MGDPCSEGKENNSDTNVEDVHHEGVPCLTVSRYSNATNERNATRKKI